MNKKRTIKITIIIIILTFLMTLIVMINDINHPSYYDNSIKLDTPKNTIESIQKAIDQKSYVLLEKIFLENHYSTILGELFFDKNITIKYGFSDKPKINEKRIITSLDFPKIEKNMIKKITDNLAMTILLIDQTNGKNLLNVAALMQKTKKGWQITKLYDFMVIFSDFIEIKDFKLHHIDNSFELNLKNIHREDNIQTTALYNLALSIEEIKVQFQEQELCSFNKNNFELIANNERLKLSDDSLHNANEFIIKGKCNYNNIITNNPEQKYLLYIILKTKKEDILIRYYGDLLL